MLTVIGLGYIGLPLACEAVRAGVRVVGHDISADVVEGLNDGRSHVDDLGCSDISSMLDAGFFATSDSSCVAEAEVIIICVPTPLSEDGTPDLTAVAEASAAVAKHLRRGALVILESTTYPGTTEEVVKPLLEGSSGLTAGVDFSLAYSPERIDPGNPTYGLRNTPKVVGGLTARCTERAVEFYQQFVDTVVPTVGLREAELSKLLENTYRHVNIALMNEMAVFCHELGVDLWAAIDAAKTKPFGYEAFYPGPGVGGHCIPIDPNYLSWTVRSLGYRFRFVELAQEISGRMPSYVARRIQEALNRVGKPVNGALIVLLGVSYKANISDQRETPARPLARRLMDLGATVRYFDPLVDRFILDDEPVSAVESLAVAVDEADMLVLLQPHDDIVGSADLARASMIVDTSGTLVHDNVERL